MTEEKIEEIIIRAVAAATANQSLPCRCDIPRAIHSRDHELVSELIEVLGRIKNIKWSLAKWLAKWLLAGLLIIIALGAREKLRIWLGWPR